MFADIYRYISLRGAFFGRLVVYVGSSRAGVKSSLELGSVTAYIQGSALGVTLI